MEEQIKKLSKVIRALTQLALALEVGTLIAVIKMITDTIF